MLLFIVAFYLSVCGYLKAESIDPDRITQIYYNSNYGKYMSTTFQLSGFSSFYANPIVASDNNNFHSVSDWSGYVEYYIGFVSKYETKLNSIWSANGYVSADVLSIARSCISEHSPYFPEMSYDDYKLIASASQVYVTLDWSQLTNSKAPSSAATPGSIVAITTSSIHRSRSTSPATPSKPPYPTPSQSSFPIPSQYSYPTPSQPSYPTPSQSSFPTRPQSSYPIPSQSLHLTPSQSSFSRTRPASSSSLISAIPANAKTFSNGELGYKLSHTLFILSSFVFLSYLF